jgi:hypothetical protein
VVPPVSMNNASSSCNATSGRGSSARNAAIASAGKCGGAIDFWSLDYTARAGRGRRYHLALIDESARDEGAWSIASRPASRRGCSISTARW